MDYSTLFDSSDYLSWSKQIFFLRFAFSCIERCLFIYYFYYFKFYLLDLPLIYMKLVLDFLKLMSFYSFNKGSASFQELS